MSKLTATIEKMQAVKIVVVGDGYIGKTSVLIKYTTGSFPSHSTGTVFDNYSKNVIVDGQPFNVGFWDTAGIEDFDRLRPLSYPQTDIFIVCFAVNAWLSHSLENVSFKWLPEVKAHCPRACLFLIGLQTDRRNDEKDIERFRQQDISYKEAASFAKREGFLKYFETSALCDSQESINKIFGEILRIYLKKTKETKLVRIETSCFKQSRTVYRLSSMTISELMDYLEENEGQEKIVIKAIEDKFEDGSEESLGDIKVNTF